jgi:hypothetical protein
MVESVATEALRPFFLQVDLCPIYESLWLALHILDSLAALELPLEPLLPAHSCCIENASLVVPIYTRPKLLFSFWLKLCFRFFDSRFNIVHFFFKVDFFCFQLFSVVF